MWWQSVSLDVITLNSLDLLLYVIVLLEAVFFTATNTVSIPGMKQNLVALNPWTFSHLRQTLNCGLVLVNIDARFKFIQILTRSRCVSLRKCRRFRLVFMVRSHRCSFYGREKKSRIHFVLRKWTDLLSEIVAWIHFMPNTN